MKKILASVLITLFCLVSLCACALSRPNVGSRGPLDVKSVTYVIYCGGICKVDMYVITSDLKVAKYEIYPEGNISYDYFAGELPSEDRYEIKEYEISEEDWESLINVLTRVNFMELKEDLSTNETIYDGSSYYIGVETPDGTNISGGYMAGYDKNSASKRFAEAQEMIGYVIKK